MLSDLKFRTLDAQVSKVSAGRHLRSAMAGKNFMVDAGLALYKAIGNTDRRLRRACFVGKVNI
jgi:hypothetical protein